VHAPWRALRHRDYRRLWFGHLVSLTGSQMQWVALDWHIYVLTGSPLALGLVGLCRVVPIVIFSLWEGRRRPGRPAEGDARDAGAMLVVALALGLVTRAGLDTVPLLYILTAASAAASAFDNRRGRR